MACWSTVLQSLLPAILNQKKLQQGFIEYLTDVKTVKINKEWFIELIVREQKKNFKI